VGAKISELDVDAIETRTLIECKKLSWITINIQGTYANIQIREAGKRPNEILGAKPSNLVATRDGQIDRLELFSGNAMVRHGDVVKKGDILVSGVWDSNHYGMFITRSSGKVFARTKREFRVEIPFEYERKTVKESKIKAKYLIFFSKEIKVFENAGNIGVSCDTIESVENLRFFNGDRLPMGTRTVRSISYETETLRYSEAEAIEIAYYRLREIMEAELSGAELLKKSIACEITDSAYILYCTVECIENIAEMQEFEYVTPG
jgi:similar to stage IV sporulation protein